LIIEQLPPMVSTINLGYWEAQPWTLTLYERSIEIKLPLAD